MPQKPFYVSETFDLGATPVNYTAAGLAAAKYTVGVTYLARLDSGVPSLNGFLSALWSPGSGAAGTVFLGVYSAVPGSSGASNGTLYLQGATANQGGAVAGIIRASFGVTNLAFPAQGNPLGGDPAGVLYGALLVKTDAVTNHVDVATSAPFSTTSQAVSADPTGTGGYPRAISSGSALLALPPTIALSGVANTTLLPWFAVD